MILGKVCGSINSTINHDYYENKRLLLVDRINPDGTETGKYLIAMDSIGAGFGETVIIVDEGNSARMIVEDKTAPLRAIIVGIVDHIDVERK